MSTQVETLPDDDINEKAAAVRALIHSILAASIFWRRWKRWCALVGAVEAVVVVVGAAWAWAWAWAVGVVAAVVVAVGAV